MKYAGWLLVGAVIIGGVYMKMSNKSEANENIKTDIIGIVHDMDCYSDNAEKLDQMCEIAHTTAFESAYSIGGRRTSSSFDDQKYINGFVDSMVAQANSWRMDQSVKDELEALRHQLSYE
jgi:hypothetical protein